MTKITRKTKKPVSRGARAVALAEGWSREDINRGYSHFNTELGLFLPYFKETENRCGTKILPALHIEVLGDLGAFDTDEDAALYGEKFFGEKIFHYDLGEDEEISLYWFVDEPLTRDTIERYLAEKYGEDHRFKPSYETEPKEQKVENAFIVQNTFFESPNFSMFDHGETSNVRSCQYYQHAERVARAVVLEILRYYNESDSIATVEACEGKDFYATFGGADFCTVHFKDVVTNIINIIDVNTGKPAHKSNICSHCGCDPEAEPYCMSPGTHCPMCGSKWGEKNY